MKYMLLVDSSPGHLSRLKYSVQFGLASRNKKTPISSFSNIEVAFFHEQSLEVEVHNFFWKVAPSVLGGGFLPPNCLVTQDGCWNPSLSTDFPDRKE